MMSRWISKWLPTWRSTEWHWNVVAITTAGAFSAILIGALVTFSWKFGSLGAAVANDWPVLLMILSAALMATLAAGMPRS